MDSKAHGSQQNKNKKRPPIKRWESGSSYHGEGHRASDCLPCLGKTKNIDISVCWKYIPAVSSYYCTQDITLPGTISEPIFSKRWGVTHNQSGVFGNLPSRFFHGARRSAFTLPVVEKTSFECRPRGRAILRVTRQPPRLVFRILLVCTNNLIWRYNTIGGGVYLAYIDYRSKL